MVHLQHWIYLCSFINLPQGKLYRLVHLISVLVGALTDFVTGFTIIQLHETSPYYQGITGMYRCANGSRSRSRSRPQAHFVEKMTFDKFTDHVCISRYSFLWSVQLKRTYILIRRKINISDVKLYRNHREQHCDRDLNITDNCIIDVLEHHIGQQQIYYT